MNLAMNHFYDRAAALNTFGNDEALLAEISGIFIADWSEYRVRMYAALATGDAEALRCVSQTLTSLVDYFAADEAAHAVRELEHACRDGIFEHVPRLLETAISAVDALAAVLRADTSRTAAPASA